MGREGSGQGSGGGSLDAAGSGMAGSSTAASPRSRRRVLRWILPSLLGLVQLAAWGTLLLGGLPRVWAWLALLSLVPALGLLSLPPTGLYAIWKRRLSSPVLATLLLSAFALWPGAWNFGVARIAYPASLAMQPAATVRLPSDQPVRVLWGGDRLTTNYHAFTPDQRWAYDLGVEPVLTQSARVQDYGCYGTPVVAPVGARVQLAHDGEPDMLPGPPSNPRKPCGNFVSLELETGTYLVLCHLQPGSVSVQDGQRVTEGQAIARCGNSGNTSEPHLHIHHQRQPFNPQLVGLAEGLPLFFRDQDGPAMPEGGFDMVGDRPTPRGPLLHSLLPRSPP